MVLFTISFLLAFESEPTAPSKSSKPKHSVVSKTRKSAIFRRSSRRSVVSRKSQQSKKSVIGRKSSRRSVAARKSSQSKESVVAKSIRSRKSRTPGKSRNSERFSSNERSRSPELLKRRSCHIRYLLSPSQMIHISVVVDGDVAKVCSKTELVALKAIRIEQNVRWVAFSVTHEVISPKNLQEISEWNRNNIEFHISEDSNDLFPRVQLHDQFINREQDEGGVDEQFFEEIFIDNDLNGPYMDTKRGLQESSADTSNPRKPAPMKLQAVPSAMHSTSIKYKILSGVQLVPDAEELHKSKRKKSSKRSMKSRRSSAGKSRKSSSGISRRSSRRGSRRNSRRSSGGNSGKSSLGKRGKKQERTDVSSRGKNKKRGDKPVITISGSKVLFDQRTWTYGKVHHSKKLLMFHLWQTTTSILKELTRKQLIPFGVHIDHIVNFPQQHNISLADITIKYSLGDLIKNISAGPSSQATNTKNNIEIDDIKMFFLGEVPLLKIVENLQMNKLVIEIFGSKIPEKKHESFFSPTEVDHAAKRLIHKPYKVEYHHDEIRAKKKPKNGGKKKAKKPKKTQKHNANSKEQLLLGYAEVNCSALAADGFRIDEEASISQYNSQETVSTQRVCQHYDLFNAHENVHRARKGAVENGFFVLGDSYIEVNLRMSGLPSTTSPERADLFENLYERIIIICRKKSIVVRVVKRILRMNGKILDHKHVEVPWVPFWFPRKLTPEVLGSYYTDEHPCMLSGFAVELENVSLLMVEGLNGYTFPEAMRDVLFLPQSYGRILYDSQLTFTERLYQEFFPFGGIYLTTCSASLDQIMSKTNVHLTEGVPTPAARALFKILRLLECRNIQMAAMNKLFPKSQDLISFNIKFGVPIYRTPLMLELKNPTDLFPTVL